MTIKIDAHVCDMLSVKVNYSDKCRQTINIKSDSVTKHDKKFTK